MSNKTRKIEKRLHELNAKELRQIERIINQIYVTEIKKQLNKKGGDNNA